MQLSPVKRYLWLRKMGTSATGIAFCENWHMENKSASPLSAPSVPLLAWVRRLLLGLVAVSLVWLLLWLAVPPLLKWQLQKQASELLGRNVTVDRVDFRPWTLELTLEGLRVAGADGASEQLSVRRIYVDAQAQSLLRWALVVDAIALEQPRLAVRHQGEGRYDLDDVWQRLAQPDEDEAAEPARFALFNLRLSGGEVVFTDEPVAVTHHIQDLVLQLPFLSSLPSQREVLTQPQLAFVLNGQAFDSRADTRPFAQTRPTEARLTLPRLDLAAYGPYWPAQWPVRPEAGVLQLALTLAFEQQADGPRMSLSGSASLSGLRLVQRAPAGQAPALPLLAFERLGVVLNRVEPLTRRVDLASVEWLGPRLLVTRDPAGRINWQQLARGWGASPSAEPKPPASAVAWDVRVGRAVIQQGALVWSDASVRPAAQLALDDLHWSADDLRWPMQAPVPFQASARLGGAPLTLQGRATDAMAQLQLSLGDLPLSLAAPYVAQVLEPALDGRVSGYLALDWRAAAGTQPMALVLSAPQMAASDLRLGPTKAPHARVQRLQLQGLQLDWVERSIGVASLELTRPQVRVERASDGQWMAERWLKPRRATGSRPANRTTEKPWKLALAQLALDDGLVGFEDRLPERPVALSFSGLKLELKNLKPFERMQAAMPVLLQMRMGLAQGAAASQADPGRLALSGTLRLPGAAAGLAWRSQVTAERLPMHALEPYFGDRLNLDLLRADTSYRGAVQLGWPAQGLSLSLAGDAALEDFRASTLSPSEDLLAWKALNLRGLKFDLAPGQATRLAVAETVLSDYFARVIVAENGRINLQGLVKADARAPAAPPESGAVSPDIRFGPVSFVNGRVFFSDRFIQPNYSANLTELTGGLSAFSSSAAVQGGPPQLADLSLRGRAEGTAALEIDGKLNPLVQPLALDIRGRVRDLELPPLSPYSVKYAGHGIERGKLSVDVAYRVAPDGQLTASNQVILNQLSFGDRAPDSQAPNLPVKLAVALLSDRNGVIDINLPVSGSLNDPEFRLGPIVVRLVLNLIGKAITAPFSLLAGALGGGGDALNQVLFSPGSTELGDAARQRLDAVAKALADRPALQLTVVGHSDLETERSSVQRERLNERVLSEKRRALARSGAPLAGEVAVTPAEYPALLKAVYQRADIPKPRNLLGMAIDLPTAEMEALLLPATPVTPDDLRELAVARAVAVKDYLSSRELPENRMFLGAPQLVQRGTGWVPQAELRLAPR
jgi:uncharacterized protein involved in outer membrane biogenesis